MKRLLDMPVLEVFKAMGRIPVPTPITVQQGCFYLMFMQAISEELEKVGGDPNKIMLERINELACLHGGLDEKDISILGGQDLIDAMLYNGHQNVLYTRLTYLTANLLKKDGDSHVRAEKQV